MLSNGQAYLWLIDVKKNELEAFFPGTIFFCYVLAVCCKTKMWLAWAPGDHMSLIPWAGAQALLVCSVSAYIGFDVHSNTPLRSWQGYPTLLATSVAIKCFPLAIRCCFLGQKGLSFYVLGAGFPMGSTHGPLLMNCFWKRMISSVRIRHREGHISLSPRSSSSSTSYCTQSLPMTFFCLLLYNIMSWFQLG